jgi:8-oxo-dGTP diphosphatase
MTDQSAAHIHAAGAVLWRHAGHGIEVALVHRPRYDDWSFAKGKRAEREHVLLTAVREVLEETGMRIVLGRRLLSTHYLVDGRPKRVDYWAAGPVGETGEFTPNDEVDGLAWLDPPAARERLSYQHDTDVLDSFLRGARRTAPVILLRHAGTVGKIPWRNTGHDDDLARPLSSAGEAQAKLLAEILTCFAPARLVSSAAERCLATIRPYSALTGAPLEAEPSFTLQPNRAAPGISDWIPTEAARDTLARTLAARAPVVICAHRQNLPTLMEWACQELNAPLLVGRPLRKGGFWVLQVNDRGLMSAERHELGGLHRAGAGRVPVQGGGQRSLERQQPALDLDAGAAAEATDAVARDHPVARHQQRVGVGCHDLAHHPGRR